MPKTTPNARFTLLDRQTGESALPDSPDACPNCGQHAHGLPVHRRVGVRQLRLGVGRLSVPAGPAHPNHPKVEEPR